MTVSQKRRTIQSNQTEIPSPTVTVITIKPEELETRIRNAVLDAIVEIGGQSNSSCSARALLTKKQLATALSCSSSTIDRLCAKGMPFVKLLDTKRFVLAEALAWIRKDGQSS